MALPILMNDGPILIERPLRSVPSLIWQRYRSTTSLSVGNIGAGMSIFLVVQTRIDAVISLTEKGPNGSADHPPTELRIRGLI